MTARSPRTKVTANFTARSIVALDAAVKLSGGSQTDTLNRAVQLYAALIAHHDGGYGSALLEIDGVPGAAMRIEINRRPWWRFW